MKQINQQEVLTAHFPRGNLNVQDCHWLFFYTKGASLPAPLARNGQAAGASGRDFGFVRRVALLVCAFLLVSCESRMPTEPTTEPPTSRPTLTFAAGSLIPIPYFVRPMDSSFVLGRGASIYVQPGTAELIDIGQYLAEKLRPATGFRIQVLTATRAPANGNIYLTTAGGDPALGEEGYELTVTPDRVSIVAYQPAGLFRGIQTIRQLLPAPIESPTLQLGPWGMAGVTIRDRRGLSGGALCWMSPGTSSAFRT